MAKQDAGFMGGFRGKLGPAVGYTWRGKWCVRSLPSTVANPQTVSQMSHREVFKRMVQCAGYMGGAITIGLRDEAHRMQITEHNLFVYHNKGCFTLQDNELHIDYEALRLSSGPVAPVAFHDLVISDLQTGSIAFTKNPLQVRASSEDTVYVYAYCPVLQQGGMAGMAPRRTKRVSLVFPSTWAEQEIHLYGFVADNSGRASETIYIGHGPLAQYAEPEPDAEAEDLAEPASSPADELTRPTTAQESEQPEGSAAPPVETPPGEI